MAYNTSYTSPYIGSLCRYGIVLSVLPNLWYHHPRNLVTACKIETTGGGGEAFQFFSFRVRVRREKKSFHSVRENMFSHFLRHYYL